jgi:hypothetical protein
MKERKKELHFIQTKNMEGFLACEIKDILVLTLSKIFFCKSTVYKKLNMFAGLV